MTKRALTCECGQEMMVPESALGRTGLCPQCGVSIPISEENTRVWEAPPALPSRRGGGLLAFRDRHKTTVNNESRENSWRRFAQAVDLYNSRRFAEALTVLNSLEDDFPGNPHVHAAREQCLEALEEGLNEHREYDGRPVQGDFLNADLIQSVILEKMLRGSTEEVQLKAAELAARMMGMIPGQGAGGGQELLGHAPASESPEEPSPPSPMIMADEAPVAEQAAATPANGAASRPRPGATTPAGGRKGKARKRRKPRGKK